MRKDDGRPAGVQCVVHGSGRCVREIHYDTKSVHLFDHQLRIIMIKRMLTQGEEDTQIRATTQCRYDRELGRICSTLQEYNYNSTKSPFA